MYQYGAMLNVNDDAILKVNDEGILNVNDEAILNKNDEAIPKVTGKDTLQFGLTHQVAK